MRFIPINYVKDGSILGKHIYDSNGRILLKKGAKLTPGLIRRVQNVGIFSVYIEDEYSDTELEDVIKPELRQQAILAVKDTFTHFEKFSNYTSNNPMANKHQVKKFNQQNSDHINFLTKISENIIDEVLSNKNVMINLVDIKSMDQYTYQHCINVAVLALVLGIELKLNKGELKDLCLGALLHDVGKNFIPKEILLKKDKLTTEEFDTIKDHSYKGYDYLKESIDVSGPARIIIAQHHERMDGAGYPKGLKGKEIYKLARIVAIADVYDALTSDRPYRKALPPNEALEYIYANGNSHFDYEMTKAFAAKVIPFPVGSLVKLSTGDIAVVEEVVAKFSLRPKVSILSEDGDQVVDLMSQTNIVIEGVHYEDPRAQE